MVNPGSPPRMRGKVFVNFYGRPPVGITPAYAGKRASRCSFGMDSRDHPRVCGEKNMFRKLESKREGSPPRMRGKALRYVVVNTIVGITPAYAGKRLAQFTS